MKEREIIYNIVHCRKIYNLFAQALEKSTKASLGRAFLACFLASAKLIIYLTTLYIYCVYPAISKSPKQLPIILKITETVVLIVLIVFNGVICDIRA
jgi:hypothetical protein